MNNELVVKAGTKIRSLDENVLREMVVTADIPVCVVGELTASLDNSGQVNKHIVFKGLQGFDREKLFCMLKLIPLQLPVGVSVVDFCPGHAYCESCGECVFCTYPHTCCCGKCGWLCNHDHHAHREYCHVMGIINHSKEFVTLESDG